MLKRQIGRELHAVYTSFDSMQVEASRFLVERANKVTRKTVLTAKFASTRHGVSSLYLEFAMF